MSESDWHVVQIEFHRIQDYIFGVPELRVMIGLNALLGQTLRGLWDARRCEFVENPPSLPRLAQLCGSRFSESTNLPNHLAQHLAPREEDRHAFRANGDYQDDVLEVALRTGVLARDGGHFEALFPSESKARQFASKAAELLAEQLGQARYDLRIRRVNAPQAASLARRDTTVPFDLPQAVVCEASGAEPACQIRDLDKRAVGTTVLRGEAVLEATRRARKERSGPVGGDALSLLEPHLLKTLGLEGLPSRFDEIASSRGYLGVVHIDGNAIGRRSKELVAPARQGLTVRDYVVTQWAPREAFFYRLRSAVRVAFLEAVNSVFFGVRNRDGEVPVRPLMLAGDDLVLVCDAAYALRFVVEFCRRAEELTADVPDGCGTPRKVTFGAGIAIVPYKFPFHRAHDLAEQLAQNAKRIYRRDASLSSTERSVVDWVAVTESWSDDIDLVRREQYTQPDGYRLTAKPYPVCQANGVCSLATLLEAARQLRAERGNTSNPSQLARTRLQRLARQVTRGYYSGQLTFELLPRELRRRLIQALGRGAMHFSAPESGLWKQIDGEVSTLLLDLVEVYEMTAEDARTPAPSM